MFDTPASIYPAKIERIVYGDLKPGIRDVQWVLLEHHYNFFERLQIDVDSIFSII